MEKPLKILQVVTSLATGGAEQVVLDLCQHGPYAGFENTIALLVEEGQLAQKAKDMGIETYCLNKRPGLDWRMVFKLKKLARKIGADLIHAHNNGCGLYAGLAGRLSGIPVVTTRHGLSLKKSTGLWLWRLVGYLSSSMVLVGHDVKELALTKVRLPENRLRLIYNGVDLKDYAPDPLSREKSRKSLGLNNGDKVAVTVGRLSEVKDQKTMIKAMAMVDLPYDTPRLLIVGDGPERKSLEDLISQLGIENKIWLLGDRRDVPNLLAASDVFVLSSLSEGISKAILEAMSVGLPVIATSVGGNPELVESEKTGLLIPVNDPLALSKAIKRLFQDVSFAFEMGKNGRKKVESGFNITKTAKAYGDLFRELVKKKE